MPYGFQDAGLKTPEERLESPQDVRSPILPEVTILCASLQPYCARLCSRQWLQRNSWIRFVIYVQMLQKTLVFGVLLISSRTLIN